MTAKNPLLCTGSNLVASVSIEYDSRGKRVVKTFTDIFAARVFYTAKDRAGKRPKISGGRRVG